MGKRKEGNTEELPHSYSGNHKPYFREFVAFDFDSTPKNAVVARAIVLTGVLPLLRLQKSKLISPVATRQPPATLIFIEKTEVSLFFFSACDFQLPFPIGSA